MKYIVLPLLLILVFQPAFSQEERKHIRKGNDYYQDGEFEKAEENYLKAMEKKPNSYEGAYNLGNATYKQGRYEDASNQFELTAKKEANKDALARSYHNLGNSLLKGKQYEKSIAAYKNALRNNPEDMDTKYNLAYAQQMLAQQQQQDQEKEGQEEKERDQKEQEENKQDQKNQDKQEQEQKEKQDQGQDDEKQKGESQPKPDKISKEDAQRLLEALKNDEQKLQEKLKKKKLKATKMKIDKDW